MATSIQPSLTSIALGGIASSDADFGAAIEEACHGGLDIDAVSPDVMA